MIRLLLRTAAAHTAAALVVAAAAQARDPDTKSGDVDLPDPAAVVEGVEIPRAELQAAFDRALAGMGIDAADLTPAQKMEGCREVLEHLVLDRLVARRAKDTTVPDSDVDAALAHLRSGNTQDVADWMKSENKDEAALREAVRDGLRTKAWMEAQIAGTDTVTDKELKDYYEGRKSDFQHPDLVRASQILILVPDDAKDGVVAEKKQAAAAALARVTLKNEDFATVAKEVSEAPGAKESGGDLGFFPKERMVPEFAEAAFALQKGAVTKEPVRSKFGWHIIKVTDRREAGVMPFDEAKEQLRAYFTEKKRGETIAKITGEIRASADVDIRLPQKNAAPAQER